MAWSGVDYLSESPYTSWDSFLWEKTCVFLNFLDDFVDLFSSPWDGIGDHESLGDFV